ncbi:hypothetical protein ZWY2020_030754, partial [Hordeum vulgare]
PCSSLTPLRHDGDEAQALTSPTSSRYEVHDPRHLDRAALPRHHHGTRLPSPGLGSARSGSASKSCSSDSLICGHCLPWMRWIHDQI